MTGRGFRRQACFLKVFRDIKTILRSDKVMSSEGRTDCKQTCSSSLMAAMLFWNLSRPQNVEIPSFVFWTRTCSRPPCSRFSESELSCLRQKEVGLFPVSLGVDITCLHQRLFNIRDITWILSCKVVRNIHTYSFNFIVITHEQVQGDKMQHCVAHSTCWRLCFSSV